LGASLEEAYLKTEVLEETAQILLISSLLGGFKPLPETEVKKIRLMTTKNERNT